MIRLFLLIGSAAKTPKSWIFERRRTIFGSFSGFGIFTPCSQRGLSGTCPHVHSLLSSPRCRTDRASEESARSVYQAPHVQPRNSARRASPDPVGILHQGCDRRQSGGGRCPVLRPYWFYIGVAALVRDVGGPRFVSRRATPGVLQFSTV